MKKVFVRLDADQHVSVSTCVQADNDVSTLDGYKGPFEVPEEFQSEQHLYRLKNGKLVKDTERAEAYRTESERIEKENRRAQRRQEALVRAAEIQAEAIAQSAAIADDVIAIAPLLPDWTPKPYAVGNVITYEDAPYRCIQAHDATGNPGWTPRAAPSLWANYHATSADYALPWAQPTGAHDMYMRGEWMIWTDGSKYECTQDTAYSPADQPKAWRKDSAGAGEVGSDGPEDPDEPPTDITPSQWVQPTGAHDAYAAGTWVWHEGKAWVSIVDNNVWAPGVYGWTQK